MRLVAGLPRTVAWSCFEEWTDAYNLLYSESPESRRKGLDMITVWTCRGRLPVAIEATAHFIELELLDHDNLSEEILRISYSMALIRFVNGIMDQQQKQVYAQSISRLAERIQFPRWLVDLRHEATHTTLPSLELLKLSVKQSLHWLKENYWEVQIDYIPSLKKEISSALDSFKKQRKEYLLDIKNQKYDKKTEEKQAYKFLVEIENIQTSELIRRLVIDEMLSPGKLFSKKRQFTKLIFVAYLIQLV